MRRFGREVEEEGGAGRCRGDDGAGLLCHAVGQVVPPAVAMFCRTVGFTCVPCNLGWLLVAATSQGVCAVKLGDTAAGLEADLRHEFPAARLMPHDVRPEWVAAIVQRLDGVGDAALPLDVRATAFQWRVWRALQNIPAGETRSYSDIAREIGHPTAVRGVARACASNPVCVVVPCHRVIAKDGRLGGYRWGTERKERLLRQEANSRRIPGKSAKKPK